MYSRQFVSLLPLRLPYGIRIWRTGNCRTGIWRTGK